MKLSISKKILIVAAFMLLASAVFFLVHFDASAESYQQNSASEQGFTPRMSLTLHSNLVVNVYIPKNSTQNFTFDGVYYDNLDEYGNIVELDGASYYKVTRELASNEAAKEMTLSVRVKFADGERTGRFVFSIPKYASVLLDTNVSNTEKTLIKDTLNYIGGAYSYFEVENAEDINQSISEIIGTYKGSYGIRSVDVSGTPGLKGATLTLGTQPGVRFYIEDGKTKSDYAFYSNNKRITDVSEGEDEFGKFICVSLHAYKMCGAISYTVDGKSGSYGIQNYYSYISKSDYTDDKKEELRDLVRRFYNYCASAADYFIEFNSTDTSPEEIDISGFSIVYPENSDESIKEEARKLAYAIESSCKINVPCISDSAIGSAKNKIFVGYSGRIANHTAVKLFKQDSEDAFILDFCDGAVSIFGKSEKSTLRAVEYFIDNYISTASDAIIALSDGASVIKPYIALENGSEIVVETVSTVFETVSGIYYGGLYPSRLSKSYYPSVIELKHNGENNGKLIAILAVNDTPTSAYSHLDTNSCVMESSDGGKSWKMIARPMETINPTYTDEDGTEYKIQGISMAHIYELPATVGDMPAGTLLYSGTSVNYDCYSQVAIWRSFDCGYTWEEYTVVATGGKTREGVWEPFTWYEESDGYLYCFYSDDSDPNHDQKIVYKRSRDGVNWSDAVSVCAFERFKDRPGMIIMTKMDSGEYLMVYEYYGLYNGAVLYKITDDISDWDSDASGNLLQDDNGYTVGGGPACVWTSAGGDNGIVFASGKTDMDGGQQHKLFVSFDYGRSWDTIENPLDYDITLDIKDTNRIGHSPVFIVGSDSSVIYYLNTTVNPKTGLQRVEFAKLRIY